MIQPNARPPKILFANPPWFSSDDGSEGKILRQGIRAGSRWPFTRPAIHLPDQFRFGGYIPYCFFLGAAASFVAREVTPSQVVLRDSIARGESYDSFLRWVQEWKPDFFIIETGAAAWAHDLMLLATLKLLLPEMRIAVAGPTAASASKATPVGTVDAWLLGEYEKNSVAFIRGALGILPFNLLTRQELESLPFPMFDEECALNYWDACPQGQLAPHLQLYASRGCYYKCSFCSFPATMTSDDPDGTKPRSVKFYSAEWVESFIRDFIAKHPDVRSIYFDDDSWNLNEKHILAICEVMKRIGLPWSAMCRADGCSREVWQVCKDSGCFGVKLGIESGSQRVVDEIVNKKLNIQEAAETARWLRSIGISVHLTFTVGLPGETMEERKQTIDFIRECYETGACDTHQLSGTATIENTPLDRIAHGEKLKVYPGAIADENFVVSHDGAKKLEEMRR